MEGKKLEKTEENTTHGNDKKDLKLLDNFIYMRPDEFYDGYVNYNTREIVISGLIDETAVQNYIMPIIRINQEDDYNDVPKEERMPIRLYFACDGGDVRYGYSLINAIKASSTPIVAINISHSYSMGTIIFICCPYRVAYPYSTFMIHEGSLGAENSTSKFIDTINFHINVMEETVKKIILENTKITKQLLNKNYSKEWYFTAQSALEYGLVDKIVDYIV